MSYDKSDKNMQDIMRDMKLIAPKKEPEQLSFQKKIYKWEEKTQAQIYKILQLEVEWLQRQNPTFEFNEFSKPVGQNDGSILYQLTFKKK